MTALLYITAVIQLLLNLYILFYEFKRASASVFLWGVLLLMFGVPHFATSFEKSMQYPSWVYVGASLFAIGLMIIYLGTMFLLEKSKGKSALIASLDYQKDRLAKKENGLEKYYVVAVIACFFVVVLFVKSVTGSIFDASWGEIFSSMTSVYQFGFNLGFAFRYTNTFNIVASGILIYYLFKKKYIMVILLSAMLLLEAIIVGEKARFLCVIIPVVIFIYIRNRKMSVKTAIKFGALVFCGLCGVILMAYTRGGTIEDLLVNFDLEGFIAYLGNALGDFEGELGLRAVFYKFIYYNNEFQGFNTGAGYVRLLLWWLPTEWSLGLKPSDFAVTMGSAWLGYQQTEFSTHPTLFGDCFANFYYFGILLGAFWAGFVFYFERFIQTRKSFLVRAGMTSALSQMYIMIARGSVYNSVYTIILSSLFLGLAYFLIYKVKIKS